LHVNNNKYYIVNVNHTMFIKFGLESNWPRLRPPSGPLAAPSKSKIQLFIVIYVYACIQYETWCINHIHTYSYTYVRIENITKKSTYMWQPNNIALIHNFIGYEIILHNRILQVYGKMVLLNGSLFPQC